MRTVQILQLSDILAGSQESIVESVLNDLTEWVAKNSEMDPVDYILVCGNVTKDAEPESFESAKRLLLGLARRLLRRDQTRPGPEKELRLTRLMVVPGRNDVLVNDAGEPDYSRFARFHENLFADEEMVKPFNPAEASYLELRDLRLIGVSYWETRDTKSKLLKSLCENLERVRNRISKSDYTSRTPSLLVSAETPLFNWANNHQDLERLGRLFDSLNITLHLFGSGSLASILPQPYASKHICLGTGPRTEDGFWPFRANLITLSVDAMREGSKVVGPFIASRFFQMFEGTSLRESPYLKGELDVFFSINREAKQSEPVYAAALRQIEEYIIDYKKRFIIITGLPGAGKGDLLSHIRQRGRLDKLRVQVECLDLVNYDEADLDRKLAELKKKLKKKQRRREGITILAIRDFVYPKLDNEERAKIQKLLDTHENPHARPGERKGRDLYLTVDSKPLIDVVLYSVPTWEFVQQFDPVRGQTKKLILRPLKEDSFRLLVKQYSYRTPVDEKFDTITGRFAGFSRLLLEESRKILKTEQGAEPISRHTSTWLLRRALSSDRVKDEATFYLSTIGMTLAGAKIREHIMGKIDDLVKRIDVLMEELKAACKAGDKAEEDRIYENLGKAFDSLQVTIDANAVAASIEDEKERTDVYETLEQLKSYGIVSLKSERPLRYRLELVAPFLAVCEAKRGRPFTTDNGKAGATPVTTSKTYPIRQATDVDFVIVTALDEELAAVLDKLPSVQRLPPRDDSIYVYYAADLPVSFPGGGTGTYRVVIMSCLKMGRVQATMATSDAIRLWRPRYVLLVGIAGGVEAKGVQLGDILISDKIVDYEIQKLRETYDELRMEPYQVDPMLVHAAHHFDAAAIKGLLKTPRPFGEGEPEVYFGTIASGDKVDAREQFVKRLGGTWPYLIGIEMEAAGAAVATFQAAYKPGFFMVRGVSDLGNSNKDSKEVKMWRKYACDVAASYAVALLKSGPVTASSPAGEPARHAAYQASEQASAPRTAPGGALGTPVAVTASATAASRIGTQEVVKLAGLLRRTGMAEKDSRLTLALALGIENLEDRSFFHLPSGRDFSVQFVNWLRETGNLKALVSLCDLLSKNLHGEPLAELQAVRQWLDDANVR